MDLPQSGFAVYCLHPERGILVGENLLICGYKQFVLLDAEQITGYRCCVVVDAEWISQQISGYNGQT